LAASVIECSWAPRDLATNYSNWSAIFNFPFPCDILDNWRRSFHAIVFSIKNVSCCTKDKIQARLDDETTTGKLYFLLGCGRTRASPRSCRFRSFPCLLLSEGSFSVGPSVDVVSLAPKIIGEITVIQSLKIAYNGILRTS
jgi:hypothetical protein